MIVIICAKYKKNPFRTVDATEQTRFSKSRPNDLEDICQGQRSSHATHPLMLVIICTKHGKNPTWTVDATGQTRKVNGQTDGQTDGRTDGQTGWIQYTPPNFVAYNKRDEKWITTISLSFVVIKKKSLCTLIVRRWPPWPPHHIQSLNVSHSWDPLQ